MSSVPAFASKDEARQYVWDCLTRMHAARFPFPPQGRIPNFAGARGAAARLLAHPLLRAATRIKVKS
jgi:5-formyltetrahydrofolate cyclo-ligase